MRNKNCLLFCIPQMWLTISRKHVRNFYMQCIGLDPGMSYRSRKSFPFALDSTLNRYNLLVLLQACIYTIPEGSSPMRSCGGAPGVCSGGETPGNLLKKQNSTQSDLDPVQITICIPKCTKSEGAWGSHVKNKRFRFNPQTLFL